MSSPLTRESILQHRPPRYEDVPVPEWTNGTGSVPVVRLRVLSASEVDRFLNSLYVEGSDGKLRYNRQDYAAKLVTLSVVNEQGQRELQDGDVVAVGQQESAAIQRLALAAERLNGLQPKPPETTAGN